MVTLQIFYLAQGLVALGFDGEREQLQVVWPGLYLFPFLWAVTVGTALSVSIPVGMDITIKMNEQLPLWQEVVRMPAKKSIDANIYSRQVT